MLRTKNYFLALNNEEHSLLLRGMEALKNEIKDGKDMEDCVKAVNELIIKIGHAKTKTFKVVDQSRDAR